MKILMGVTLALVMTGCGNRTADTSALQSEADHQACVANTATAVEAVSYKLWMNQSADNEIMQYLTGVTAEGFEATYDKIFAENGKDLTVQYQGPLTAMLAEHPEAKIRLGIKINGADREPILMEPLYEGAYAKQLKFTVPQGARTLALWFEAELPNGERRYDSNFNNNYPVEVVRTPTTNVCFDDGWQEVVSTDIRSHQTISVNYDTRRILRYLEGSTYNGLPAYTLTGYVRFTDESGNNFGSETFPLQAVKYSSNGNSRQSFRPVISVPGGATKAVFWFKGDGRGRPHFDSNYGENFVFPVR